MMKNSLIIILSFFCCQTLLLAHLPPDDRGDSASSEQVSFRNDCANAVAQIDLDINNVRARLLSGGDLWWNGTDGRYVVPKPAPGMPEVSSIFAAGLWLGGKDPGGNLKIAAQTYGRNGGNFDFYPGPLNPGDPTYPNGPLADPNRGTTDPTTCANWDRFFTVTGAAIEEYINLWQTAVADGLTPLDPADISDEILGWPARGNAFFEDIHQFPLPNTAQGLAGFWDQDLDGIYEPDQGDHPMIEVLGCVELPNSFPDEIIFWIFNDAGGVHNESNSPLKMQMEVHGQAFAYETNDDINNTTFLAYKLINRAIERIDSTYFGFWVDPDLGCHTDDYIGCDPERNLSYIYNADAVDGTTGCVCDGDVPTYCEEIPILGIDYLRGPLNELGEELGMSSFTYYNSGGIGVPTQQSDPQTPQEYYNYLSGRWRDGTPFTYGGNAYMTGEPYPYAFPDSPDDGQGWSMCSENLPLADRRFIQSSGPFTLLPGAVNELIIGAIWVPNQEYPCPSIARLQKADDLAQALFDGCIDPVPGPFAPDVDWVELDREIIAILSNDESSSNNAFESFKEVALYASEGADSIFLFEGYKIYQFSGPDVSLKNIDNPEKVRLVRQVDKKNGVGKIFNWQNVNDFTDETPTTSFHYYPELKVDGQDQGIQHTFRITEDQFAEGDKRLVNHKKYYFTAIAYAHNEYAPFDPHTGLGQDQGYWESQDNIGDGQNSYYTVIPRKITDRSLHANYGDGPIVTRVDGVGNGGNFLDISSETRNEIEELIKEDNTSEFSGEVTYQSGLAPIDVKIYNPLDVIDGEYELTFVDANMANETLDAPVKWVLRSLTDPAAPVITSEQPITTLNEQIIRKFGFSVIVDQVADAGQTPFGGNGVCGYGEEYQNDGSLSWLSGLPDDTRLSAGNPILDPGMYNYVLTASTERDYSFDPDNFFATNGRGYFLPYFLADFEDKENMVPYLSPGWLNASGSNIVRNQSSLADLNNVDIVLTSNKDLWSRCVVVESANRYYEDAGFITAGERDMFDTRAHASVSKNDNNGDGLPDIDSPTTVGEEEGFGWFPGYAIDVETGKRLNIFFGENSTYNGGYGAAFAGGNDMMWNPSDVLYQPLEGGGGSIYNYVSGAQQYIYVTDTEYDRCAYLNSRLKPSSSFLRKVNGLQQVTWAGFLTLPRNVALKPYQEGIIPNDVVIKLRVDNPYQIEVGTGEFNGYPTYRFELENKQATSPNEVEITEALQYINVVPNPYYGFSDYENSAEESLVKITNLPAECVVTIYSLEGDFVRQFNRFEAGMAVVGSNRAIDLAQINPDLEWDLKNFKQIPIASGVYLIHVNAPGLGERTLKWFGVNRQFDPSGL